MKIADTSSNGRSGSSIITNTRFGKKTITDTKSEYKLQRINNKHSTL